MRINHRFGGWEIELNIIFQLRRGKGCMKKLLKMTFAETVYAIWTTRNNIIFQNRTDDCLHSKDIIDMVIFRLGIHKKMVIFCNRI